MKVDFVKSAISVGLSGLLAGVISYCVGSGIGEREGLTRAKPVSVYVCDVNKDGIDDVLIRGGSKWMNYIFLGQRDGSYWGIDELEVASNSKVKEDYSYIRVNAYKALETKLAEERKAEKK